MEDTLRLHLLQVNASYAEHVLDIGCGDGRDMAHWNRCNIHRVVALDIDQDKVQIAEKKQEDGGPSICTVEFVRCDCLQSDWGLVDKVVGVRGPYNVITCMMTLQYIASRESVVRAFLKHVSSLLGYYGKFVGIVPADTTGLEPGLKFYSSAQFGRQGVRAGVPEFIVDFEALKRVAMECSLTLQNTVVSGGYRTFTFHKHIRR